MKFTLRQLEAFLAVTHTLHFGRAAAMLGIAQPTLSGDLRTLEKALGVRLFERSSRGTEITEEGRALVPFAESVIASAERLDVEARRLEGVDTTPIRLAATPSMVNRLIPSLLQRTLEEAGAPVIEVVEVDTSGARRALADGSALLAVGHFLSRPPGGGVATIGEDEMWVLARSGLLNAAEPVRLEDLEIPDLLNFSRESNPEYYDAVVETLREHGFRGEVRHSPVRLSGSYSFLLTAGDAFAVVPEAYARESSHALSAAPLEPRLTIPVDVAWSGDRTARVERMVRLLSRTHRELVRAR